jgi:hypothetical protein
MVANHFQKAFPAASRHALLAASEVRSTTGDIQFGASGKEFRDATRSGSYHGIIIRNTADEGTIYVPLHANQIKSAIGNRGTFSLADPDIRRVVVPFTLGGASAAADH